MRCMDRIRQLRRLKLIVKTGNVKANKKGLVSTLATIRTGTKDDVGLLLLNKWIADDGELEVRDTNFLICISLYLQCLLSGLPCLTKWSTTLQQETIKWGTMLTNCTNIQWGQTEDIQDFWETCQMPFQGPCLSSSKHCTCQRSSL